MGIKFDLPTLMALTEDVDLPEEGSPRTVRWFIPSRGRRRMSPKVHQALRRLDHRLAGRLQFDPFLARMRSQEVLGGRAGEETCGEIARLAVRADRSWLRIRQLFEHARLRANQRRLREARSRGGSHTDPIRAAIVDRIVQWLNESDEVRKTPEIWESFRSGRMRLRGGLAVEAPDRSESGPADRVVVTSERSRPKPITVSTFKRYVTEARRIVELSAQ